MFTPECIPALQALLKVFQACIQLPLQWDMTYMTRSYSSLRGGLRPSKSNRHRSLFKFRVCTLAIYTTFIAFRLCQAIHQGKTALSQLLPIIPFVVCQFGATMIGIELIIRPNLLCYLFNESVYFWKWNYRNQNENNFLYYFLRMSAILFPAFALMAPMIFWLMPCSPLFLFSLFSPTCSASGFEMEDLKGPSLFSSFSVKFLFYCMEAILLTAIAGIGGMIVVTFNTLLTSFNKYLKRILELVKHRKGKRNRQALLYRQVQILIGLFNECFADYLIPIILVIHAICIIVSLFALIEMKQGTSSFSVMAGYTTYTVMLIAVIAIDLVLMECASKPVPLSKMIIGQWKKCQYHEANLWLSKFCKSCPVLKIYTNPRTAFGRDRLAIFLRFCLQRTIFLVVYHRKINVPLELVMSMN